MIKIREWLSVNLIPKQIKIGKMNKYILIFFSLFLSINTFGQNIQIRSGFPKQNAFVNEVFEFKIVSNKTFTCNNPDFGELAQYKQPLTGRNSKTSIVNNQLISIEEYSITYYLVGKEAKRFNVGNIKIEVENKSFDTKATFITLTKRPKINKSNLGNTDYFVELNSNKTELYQGEHFLLSLKIYSLNKPAQIQKAEFAKSNKYIGTILNSNNSNVNIGEEIINNKKFYTAEIIRQVCETTETGRITIGPGFVSTIFSRGFMNRYAKEQFSNELVINVKPLPNTPENYSGLVGNITLETNLNRTEIKTGEALDFQLIIKGQGNLLGINTPEIQTPTSFQKITPDKVDNTKIGVNGSSGQLIYNYVFIPSDTGVYKIPSVEFVYFNSQSQTFETASTESYQIKVNKGVKVDNLEKHSELDKSSHINNTDIHFLSLTNEETFNKDQVFGFSVKHICLLASPFILLIGFTFFKKKMNSSDKIIKRQFKEELAKSNIHISNAKEHAHKNNNMALKELSFALQNQFQKKYQLAQSEMNFEKMNSKLKANNFDDSVISLFKSTWQSIEMFQYAPVTSGKIDELIKDSESIINSMNEK